MVQKFQIVSNHPQRIVLFAVGLGSSSPSRLPLAVRLLVEVREQEQEHDAVQSDPHHETFRVVAVGKQQLELVREDCHKLQLQVARRRTERRKWLVQMREPN